MKGQGMQNAAIIGAGLIGRAWANVFARAGWSVRVWDPDAGQRAVAAKLIEESLHDLAAHGLVTDPAGAHYGVGGGIVWDSDSGREWEELLWKQRGVE